jgi:hypothetical protein
MSLALFSGPYWYGSPEPEENTMTATYTFDVFSSLDGYIQELDYHPTIH